MIWREFIIYFSLETLLKTDQELDLWNNNYWIGLKREDGVYKWPDGSTGMK